MTGTRPVKAAAYLAVTGIWIAGLVILGVVHREPYPGLFQPSFAVTPGEHENPTVHVTYLVDTANGTETIDPLELLHPAGGKEAVLAVTLLNDANESDVELRRWLAARVDPLVESDARTLRVTWFEDDTAVTQKTFDLR